jgi:hypothetical protein
LRFLAIEIDLPVRREWNDPNSALCRQGLAAKQLPHKTVAIQETLTHGGPEPTAHYSRFTRPFLRAFTKDTPGDLGFIRIERRIGRS